jgi:FAD dependent oxidoreductase TIGR03364
MIARTSSKLLPGTFAGGSGAGHVVLRPGWSGGDVGGRVVVVGGGIVGSMHAWFALRRGYQVVQLERDGAARGASVRNFGLVWVSGRAAGAELDLATRARARWEDVGADVPGVGFRPAGSLTVATTPAEVAVLEQAAAGPDAAARGFRLLTPAGTRAVNPALRGDILAALHCARDAVVEPRRAVAALRAAMSVRDGYRFVPGAEVVSYEANAVRDSHGRRWAGDLVVLATGAAHGGVVAAHLAAQVAAHAATQPLRRCRLQMMETAPLGEPLPTAVADGDSLRYYPAFTPYGAADLPPQAPVAAARRMQLLMVQRADGGLTIGDTHAYDEPFAFDVDEEPYDHLRAVAERLLGRPLPPVVRRWAGIYSELAPGAAGGAVYHRSRLADGVVLVTGPGGRGMTCSPAIAEDTLRAFDGAPATAAAAAE